MARCEDYLSEARKFRDVSRRCDLTKYTNQAVSNMELAVIAANDAICLRLTNERPGGESHHAAVRALLRACKGTEWEQEAARSAERLAQVLQQKNAAQYSGTVLPAQVSERVIKQAERFVEWAERVLGSPDPPR
jgi:hypothetical protein